ncbi:hypothetical protein [Streptomyces sparsogenes]|uniref:NADH dehydrogenase n=1 Tax=Streptomyces sparsogenes DSM 40356 TaxID=1331668 RepID=A0A1R1SBF0_9ACTN|nr:hypothetical protein [Streptomyces sparsogenes]OMI35349.1 NADH dehydrogenase [Streptomyces sparsogenes DSM 40356]
MHLALLLRRSLGHRQATVTILDAHSHMTYQPLPAEAAAGSVEPHHVVVPPRQALPRAHAIIREVISIDHAQRIVYLRSCGAAASTRVWCPPKEAAVISTAAVTSTTEPSSMPAPSSCPLSKLPSVNRRLRAVVDRTPALMFPREIMSMEAIEHSHEEFTLAASAATKRTP